MIENLAAAIADRLAGVKCSHIKIVDVREITPLAETYLVATCRSESQLEGALNLVLQVLKEAGHPLKNVEYKSRALWCLIDCSDLIVHLFAPGERERMKFDELFAACQTVEVGGEPRLEPETEEEPLSTVHEIDGWR